uniref:Uncharacterized protein n=1 Tax=Timema shepardi TaxID=629360 RepID=A0A7R9G5X6_TIMSH|nr:unnamed protein product [Timema shepardi]
MEASKMIHVIAVKSTLVALSSSHACCCRTQRQQGACVNAYLATVAMKMVSVTLIYQQRLPPGKLRPLRAL